MVGHFSIINAMLRKKEPMRVRILSFYIKRNGYICPSSPSITFKVLENKKEVDLEVVGW